MKYSFIRHLFLFLSFLFFDSPIEAQKPKPIESAKPIVFYIPTNSLDSAYIKIDKAYIASENSTRSHLFLSCPHLKNAIDNDTYMEFPIRDVILDYPICNVCLNKLNRLLKPNSKKPIPFNNLPYNDSIKYNTGRQRSFLDEVISK